MQEVFTESGIRCLVIDDHHSLAKLRDFLKMIQDKGKYIGFDTETTSKYVINSKLVGMSFAASRREGFYIPVGHDFGDQLPLEVVLGAIGPVLQGPGITAANGKFDIRVMRRQGIEVQLSADSMSITRLLGEVEYGVGLKPTIKRFYGEDVTEFTDVVPRAKKGKPQPTFAQVEITEGAKYAVPDAINTWRLTVDGLERMPDETKKLLLDLEYEMMRLASHMEDHGLPIDKAFVERQIEAGQVIETQLYQEAIAALEQLASTRGKTLPTPKGGINLRSSAQLREILFDICELPVVKRSKKTKNPSADADVLEKLAKQFGPVNKIAEYRSCGTTIGRLEEFLQFGHEHDDGWWWTHASLNPTGTSTGRWSGSDPNTQNLTRGKTEYVTQLGEWLFKLKDAICVPEGFGLVSGDYSQIELRMAAGFSQSVAWMKAFTEGADIHRVTASSALGVPFEQITDEQRQIGKTLNFSMIYGAGATNVAERLGISEDLAERFVDGFWLGLPEYASWVDATKGFLKKNKYTKTYFGRRRYLHDVDHEKRWIREKAAREGVNHPIQGTAGDILKIALARQWDEMKAMGAMAFMLIHDQIVWMVPLEVSPEEFCTRIRPRIEIPIPDFPRTEVDFGIGDRLGSLVEYKAGREIPGSWEDVAEEAREVTVERVLVSVDRALTKTELADLKTLLAENTGDRVVTLRCAQGEFELPVKTSLGVHDRLRWQAAVKDVRVTA